MSEQLVQDWTTMVKHAGPYPRAAFEFVRDGLGYTAEIVHTGAESIDTLASHEDEGRHVSGQQLCFGLKDYAIKQYGGDGLYQTFKIDGNRLEFKAYLSDGSLFDELVIEK